MHPIPAGVHAGSLSARAKPTMILLVRDGSTWRAFSNRSTHLSEPIYWREDYGGFIDPYSGSVWNKAGHRLAGPAVLDLEAYLVIVEGDNVIIDLAKPDADLPPR